MKNSGLYKKMIRLSIFPVLLLGVAVMIFCYYRFTGILYEEARTSMQNLAGSIEKTYTLLNPGNYYLSKRADDTYDLFKGEKNITTDYSVVDFYKELSGDDVSLLYKDMRIHTTFATDKGVRMAGICTNADTSDRVLNSGEEVFYNNIGILTEKYLVLYVPLKNEDGSVIGMIEIARNQKSLQNNVWKAVLPILLIAALGMAVAILYSIRRTREITGVIRKLQSFMNKVATGALLIEPDKSLTKRTDELGDMAKSAIEMQRSIRGFVGADALTGLNNRRYVQEALQHIKERAAITGTPFSIAICDIDFFKSVNDTYGHNAGDEVLKAVANILKKSMTGNGFAARWGGEEFVLIFDKTNMEASVPILVTILDRIRACTIETEGYSINVTMTMGIVDGNQDADTEAMIEAADEKLYYGKQHGRNQIVYAIPEE